MDSNVVRVEHTQMETVDNVLRAGDRPHQINVLKQLMEEGKRRVEDEIRAQGLTPDGALVVRVTVERFCTR